MAVASSSPSKDKAVASDIKEKDNEKELNRTKCTGVRVQGSRINDSENGKTCHQCRQKTVNLVTVCKIMKKDKQCTIKFCPKCLLNRYGEKAEDVALLDNWNCPKCRGICNCSFCMKKRGHKPTGQLFQTAKATGFSSVFEMLQSKGYDNLNHAKKITKDVAVSPKKSRTLNKDPGADLPRKLGKENFLVGGGDSHLNFEYLSPGLNIEKSKKMEREGLKEIPNSREGLKEIPNSNGDDDVSLRKKSPKETKVSEEISEKEKLNVSDEKPNGVKDENSASNLEAVSESCEVKECIREIQKKKIAADVLLPQGITLTNVAGVEIPTEDVGRALQFLEFCTAFGKVLDLKKGQAESIIRELMAGRSRRRGQCFPVVQIHIQLLSLIHKDMGEESPLSSTSGKNSWLQALGKRISESKCPMNDIPSDCFDGGSDGYDQLDGIKKLKLLNFLCDEALGTTALRSWIDDQNSKFVEQAKESREKVVAAKQKKKQLKQKMQDDVAKAIITNGAPLSIPEHEAIVSETKRKAAEAHSEMAKAMASKKKQRADALRTEPIMLEDNGRAFWRLNCYNDEPAILLRDVERTEDAMSPNEKWFAYDADQIPAVEKYVSSKRAKRRRVQKNTNSPTIASVETNSENVSKY